MQTSSNLTWRETHWCFPIGWFKFCRSDLSLRQDYLRQGYLRLRCDKALTCVYFFAARDRSDKILSQRQWFSHVTRGDLLQQPVAATCRSDLSTASCISAFTSCSMLLQLATLKFVAWQVACRGGNTGNKALQVAKRQCSILIRPGLLTFLLEKLFTIFSVSGGPTISNKIYLDHMSLDRETNFQWSTLREHSEQLHRTLTACSTESQLLDFFRIRK